MATTTISEVRICNMALSHVGTKSSIESITEDSPEAKQCDLWYDFSRRQALAVNDWSFARKRLTLATHSDDPPDGIWGFRYQYPSDCIKFRELQNPGGKTLDAVPFESELDLNQQTKTIVTDLDDAVGVYTFNLIETTLFSELFVEVLSLAIGVHIAKNLTGKKSIRDDLLAEFNQLVRVAGASDGNESMGAPPRESEWIRGRA